MKKRTNEILLSLLICLVFLSFLGCITAPSGIFDDSRDYYLPYEAGSTYGVVQAENGIVDGIFSHKNKYAYDFVMDEGTPVVAARCGKVVMVVENNDESCPDGSCDGNGIWIGHEDNTVALYYHLQKDGAVVVVGENVNRGQIIGFSGSTGMSAIPHLHFSVDPDYSATTGPTAPIPGWQKIPVNFADVHKDGVVEVGWEYTSWNETPATPCYP